MTETTITAKCLSPSTSSAGAASAGAEIGLPEGSGCWKSARVCDRQAAQTAAFSGPSVSNGRLALKTDLKSGLFIVARPGKPVAPCRISSRTYVGEERDGVSFGVGAPKDHAANLRRAVKPRGGELKNGERRTAGLRACHEGRPDPIQVRFDHSQPLETWNSAVRLSRRVSKAPRRRGDRRRRTLVGAGEHWNA